MQSVQFRFLHRLPPARHQSTCEDHTDLALNKLEIFKRPVDYNLYQINCILIDIVVKIHEDMKVRHTIGTLRHQLHYDIKITINRMYIPLSVI